VKRQKLLSHLREHGCHVFDEGGKHTRVTNPANGKRTTVPRHREINDYLAERICKQLDVPLPSGT
jgi:mRNA interferase HicA